MKGYERPFHCNSCLYELPLSKLKPFSSELKFASIQHVRSRLSYFRMQIATSLAIMMMCCLLPEDECLRSENQSKRYNLRNVSCELRHCVKTSVFFLLSQVSVTCLFKVYIAAARSPTFQNTPIYFYEIIPIIKFFISNLWDSYRWCIDLTLVNYHSFPTAIFNSNVAVNITKRQISLDGYKDMQLSAPPELSLEGERITM